MFNRKLCYEEKSNVFISALESKVEENAAGAQATTANEFGSEEKNATSVICLLFIFIRLFSFIN